MMQCPTCGSAEVHKILSPVAVQKSGFARKDFGTEGQPEAMDQTASALALWKAVGQFVVSNFEDVGTRLAEESLKMHYGIAEHRNIRGVASAEEEKTLKKEGIELLKIPFLTEEDEMH